MADSDLVTPQKQNWFVGDVNYRTALSEALLRKIASSINYINNRVVDRYAFNMGGFFQAHSNNDYIFPSVYIKTSTNVSYYTMSVGSTGSAGNNSINFKVINASGVVLGDLFSVAPVINQVGLLNALVGYDVKNSSELRKVTTTGYNNGTINPSYVNLLAGYELRMFVVSNSVNALNITVNLGLEAQE